MNSFSMMTLTCALSIAIPIAAVARPAHVEHCPAVTPATIAAQFDRFTDAWATLDPDAVTALFTAEPVLLPTISNEPRTTRAGVRDYFVLFFANKPTARIDTSTIEIDCHTASRLGTWTVTLTDAATGQKRDVAARYSFIYRYEANNWKIDHLHSSVMPQR